MWLYNKPYEVSGLLKYENYASEIMVSGLKTMTSPAYITGIARFIITKREHKVMPFQDGRITIDRILTQFGWDVIRNLNETGIYLNEPGRLKLTYNGENYRLVYYDDFGRPLISDYNPLGVIEAVFEKERSRQDAN